jgi:hypothetical protein
MAQTALGARIEAWSANSKSELKSDLSRLSKFPPDLLWSILVKVAKTYPACNTSELAALEAEERGIKEAQELYDVISVWTYIWENSDGESPQEITADLIALELLSKQDAEVLFELLTKAAPFRQTAEVMASYLHVGAPLFVGLRGVVDVRCRFHRTDEEFFASGPPSELVDTFPVVLANLTINAPGDKETVVSFLMDENDLSYMKRFVRQMEKELELTKSLLKLRS